MGWIECATWSSFNGKGLGAAGKNIERLGLKNPHERQFGLMFSVLCFFSVALCGWDGNNASASAVLEFSESYVASDR